MNTKTLFSRKGAYLRVVRLLLLLAAALLLITPASAAPFVYSNRDLMLCLRKTGQTGSAGQFDVEINIGQASRYYGATAGSTLSVTQFSAVQLTGAFDNLNDMSWSVGGMVPLGTGDATYPDRTLWVTAPRSDPAVPASSWIRRSSATQGPTATKINTVMYNASSYSSLISGNGTNNTTSLVWVPSGDPSSYDASMGPLGTYLNTFQGNVENTTPSDFDTSGAVSRSDLYELKPGTGAGTYLGYFELRANGTVVFVAGNTPPPPPAPTLAVTRANTTTTISFATSNGASYDLRFTNLAGLASPVTTWPVILNVTTGDGTVKAVTDATSDLNRVYRVEAH